MSPTAFPCAQDTTQHSFTEATDFTYPIHLQQHLGQGRLDGLFGASEKHGPAKVTSVGVFQQVGGKRNKQTGKILIFPNHKIPKLGILLGEFQLPSLLVLISHFLSYHTPSIKLKDFDLFPAACSAAPRNRGRIGVTLSKKDLPKLHCWHFGDPKKACRQG